MSGRRKRYSDEVKKPASTRAIIICILSVAAMLYFVYAVRVSADTAGEAGLLTCGIGLVLMVISLLLCTEGFRIFREPIYSRASRVAGFVPALLAALLWISTWLLGLLAH